MSRDKAPFVPLSFTPAHTQLACWRGFLTLGAEGIQGSGEWGLHEGLERARTAVEAGPRGLALTSSCPFLARRPAAPREEIKSPTAGHQGEGGQRLGKGKSPFWGWESRELSTRGSKERT
jgi:hypothetical protein